MSDQEKRQVLNKIGVLRTRLNELQGHFYDELSDIRRGIFELESYLLEPDSNAIKKAKGE